MSPKGGQPATLFQAHIALQLGRRVSSWNPALFISRCLPQEAGVLKSALDDLSSTQHLVLANVDFGARDQLKGSSRRLETAADFVASEVEKALGLRFSEIPSDVRLVAEDIPAILEAASAQVGRHWMLLLEGLHELDLGEAIGILENVGYAIAEAPMSSAKGVVPITICPSAVFRGLSQPMKDRRLWGEPLQTCRCGTASAASYLAELQKGEGVSLPASVVQQIISLSDLDPLVLEVLGTACVQTAFGYKSKRAIPATIRTAKRQALEEGGMLELLAEGAAELLVSDAELLEEGIRALRRGEDSAASRQELTLGSSGLMLTGFFRMEGGLPTPRSALFREALIRALSTDRTIGAFASHGHWRGVLTLAELEPEDVRSTDLLLAIKKRVDLIGSARGLCREVTGLLATLFPHVDADLEFQGLSPSGGACTLRVREGELVSCSSCLDTAHCAVPPVRDGTRALAKLMSGALVHLPLRTRTGRTVGNATLESGDSDAVATQTLTASVKLRDILPVVADGVGRIGEQLQPNRVARLLLDAIHGLEEVVAGAAKGETDDALLQRAHSFLASLPGVLWCVVLREEDRTYRAVRVADETRMREIDLRVPDHLVAQGVRSTTASVSTYSARDESWDRPRLVQALLDMVPRVQRSQAEWLLVCYSGAAGRTPQAVIAIVLPSSSTTYLHSIGEVIEHLRQLTAVAFDARRRSDVLASEIGRLEAGTEMLASLAVALPETDSQTTLQTILDAVLDQALKCTGASEGTVHLVDRDAERIILKCIRASEGVVASAIIDANLPLGDGVCGRVAKEGRTYRINDVLSPAWRHWYKPYIPGMRSMLAVPIHRRDSVLGVLNVESPHPFAFGKPDEQVLRALGAVSAFLIEPYVAATGDPVHRTGLEGGHHEFDLSAIMDPLLPLEPEGGDVCSPIEDGRQDLLEPMAIRLATLRKNMAESMQLLSEYEDELRTEDDPGRRKRWTRRIEQLRTALRASETEYKRIRTRNPAITAGEITSAASSDIEPEGLFRQLFERLDVLQRELAASLRSSAERVIRALSSRLDESEASIARDVADLVEANAVPREEMDQLLALANEGLIALADVAQPEEAADADGVLEALTSSHLSTSHKIKLAVPIIPFLLKYEGDLGWEGKADLRELWSRVQNKLRRKED